jgi:hypothetical protein
MWISWDELGAPTTEGSYEIRYRGQNDLRRRDEERDRAGSGVWGTFAL